MTSPEKNISFQRWRPWLKRGRNTATTSLNSRFNLWSTCQTLVHWRLFRTMFKIQCLNKASLFFKQAKYSSHMDSETKFNINLRQESSFSILGWTSARRGDIYQQSKVSTRSNWYEPGNASRFLRKLFLPCWFVLMSCKWESVKGYWEDDMTWWYLYLTREEMFFTEYFPVSEGSQRQGGKGDISQQHSQLNWIKPSKLCRA